MPVLAIDPVAEGAKVSAHANALHWPALLPAEGTDPAALSGLLRWCLSPACRDAVRTRSGTNRSALLDALMTELAI